jgi:hypothetical protein
VSPGAGVDIVGKRSVFPYQELNPYHPAHNKITILIGLSELKKYRSRKTKGGAIRIKIRI